MFYFKTNLFNQIEIAKSFRCGDVILARVISLGDTNSYFLSCAENELGVIIAYSEAGIEIDHNYNPFSNVLMFYY